MSTSGEGDGDGDDCVMDVIAIITGMTPAEDGQLMLAPYLHAYTHMIKIFRYVGPFFQFAANDVEVKMRLLWGLVEGDNGHHYSSIQSMIAYERDNNLLNPTCGSRTLLRLHRALEFVREFARELINTNEDESFKKTSSELYSSTLGRFHSKVLAKTFSGVMLMLMPPKQTLVERLCGGDAGIEEEFRRRLPKLVEVLAVMYDKTQHLLHDNDMLDLP